MTTWLPWAPLAAALLHITEEFVYPGGFPGWYRRYREDPSKITPRFLVIVNGALMIACLNVVQLGPTLPGAVAWLAIVTLMSSNGIWHAFASLKSHSYSPGVVTGMVVYVPLMIYGYIHYIESHTVPWFVAAVAGLVGASYHVWSALYHRPRTNRSSQVQ